MSTNGTRRLGVIMHTRTRVPSESATRLRQLSDLLVKEVLREIQDNVDAYAPPLPTRLHAGFVHVIETGIDLCFDAVFRTGGGRADWRPVIRAVGEGEFLRGRTTEPLQAALRIGARVVWRHVSLNAAELGASPESLSDMAEAVFAWVDELSREAIAGHHDAQARARERVSHLDVREQARQQLARIILSGGPADQEWVRTLAQAADWPLPDRVVTIAVEPRGENDDLDEIAALREVLVDRVDSASPCVVMPDPGQERDGVADLLAGRRAAVGPAVGLAEAHRSLLLARRLLGLSRARDEPTQRISWCQDNLTTLLLLVDPFLTAQLQEHIETAFAGLTHKQRDRMATTLLAWLQRCGTHNEIAARLDVHPQTFRYRVHQLQELLGDKLADPDARLAMELALRARMLFETESG
ncbi:helix-turn-helix domain-containing protein [Actinophytocola oryzae]|nr:helix-turn-helix domain-containing protein [Actinophytocola oryzae]